MKITGNTIFLQGDELALAIEAWLVAHAVRIRGPRTIRVHTDDSGSLEEARIKVIVDPSGGIADNR